MHKKRLVASYCFLMAAIQHLSKLTTMYTKLAKVNVCLLATMVLRCVGGLMTVFDVINSKKRIRVNHSTRKFYRRPLINVYGFSSFHAALPLNCLRGIHPITLKAHRIIGVSPSEPHSSGTVLRNPPVYAPPCAN